MLLLGLALVSLWTAAPAQAAEYASWDDVERARKSEAATKALVAEIRSQIEGLEAEAAEAAAIAEEKGRELELADQAFQEAAFEADRLAGELAKVETEAADSYRQAGTMAVQLSRLGGPDLTASIVGSDAKDDLLLRLNSVDRVGKVSNAAYEKAMQDRNAVDAIAGQAEAAKDVLSERRAAAERLLGEAQQASAAAQAAVDSQVAQQAELNAQLAVLTENRMATEADFRAGEAARRAEEERRARARAEAAAGGGSAQPSASGWANPTSGWISSPYGYRIHPVYGTYRLHTGTDIAGWCGAPIYAASSGTVSYSGVYGTYGNFILIDHGGGVQTGYAHIQDGGLLVAAGTQVQAGQLIARQGTTGASTGCHLHLEVRVDGGTTDPVPYLRQRGAGVGG